MSAQSYRLVNIIVAVFNETSGYVGREKIGIGRFHGWGVKDGNTVAIVETKEGSVNMLSPENIEFCGTETTYI